MSNVIQIIADKTQVDLTLQEINQQVNNIHTSVENQKTKLYLYFRQATHLSSIILHQFKDQAWAQNILAVQSVIMTQASIVRMGIQSSAAFAAGNVVQGSILAALAGSMELSLIQAEAQRQQTERHKAFMDQLADAHEMYSPRD